MKYRPELDGIRGIAVMLVIADHTHVLEQAGRVGVTMFFVLSGYLITSLLLTERKRTGHFSLRGFYERRARRLLPALIALVAATGVLVLALGLDPAYPGHAAAALFYFANIAYDPGYLGHTWSLSLEEQFYLLWPAVVVLAPGRLRWIALTGIAVATGLRFLTPGGTPESFGPLVRFDAVLWGCLLALVPIRAQWLSTLGWAVIVAVIFVIPNPQTIGLTAVAIASVAIIAGARPGILSSRPLVRVGQISYGLYLWHMAPALLLRGETREGNVAAIALVIASSVLLALASEKWIERPWRLRRDLERKPRIDYVGAAATE